MPHDARRTSLPREALTRARPHSGQCIPHEARAQSTDFFHHYSLWLPSWRALRRGARLLLRQRAAAHAPRPQSKHSPLTSFTTTLAGSRAGARCDAARGCCGSGGRRRTRRGPKVSTVYLLLSLLLSLAPELARAATRREAAAAVEGGGTWAAAPAGESSENRGASVIDASRTPSSLTGDSSRRVAARASSGASESSGERSKPRQCLLWRRGACAAALRCRSRLAPRCSARL